MSQFIDRREGASKKSTVNRQRFLRRYKEQIQKAVSEAISKRKISNIAEGEKVVIPTKDTSEPHFQIGRGGKLEEVMPGNDQYTSGDKVPRSNTSPSSGTGEGNASQSGEGEDAFVFELTREEFLELYFDDLALPDLVKKDFARLSTLKTIRQGIATSGIPSNINITRSMRQATGRRVALRNPYKKKLKEVEEAFIAEQDKQPINAEMIKTLEEKIALLKKKIYAIPFIDNIDLRYNNRIKVLQPTTQAVMFCLMDVSGSMDEAKKDIAKRFFILLYLFLTKNYKKIDIVFIRHHTSAKEVNEEEFFYSRETGGTVVSSALELLLQIIEKRFPPQAWNIYVAQASDGDNWNADSPHCEALLKNKIMPLVQYFAYIEIMPRHHQSLWEVYQKVEESFPHFCMKDIETVTDIYPVFHELFKRKSA